MYFHWAPSLLTVPVFSVYPSEWFKKDELERFDGPHCLDVFQRILQFVDLSWILTQQTPSTKYKFQSNFYLKVKMTAQNTKEKFDNISIARASRIYNLKNAIFLVEYIRHMMNEWLLALNQCWSFKPKSSGNDFKRELLSFSQPTRYPLIGISYIKTHMSNLILWILNRNQKWREKRETNATIDNWAIQRIK